MVRDIQMVEETIGQRLKRLREEAGLSKRELARRSGIDRLHIYQIEIGKVQSPTIKTVAALANGLDISPIEFFDGHSTKDRARIKARLIEYIRRFEV